VTENILSVILLMVLSYLLGSIPSAYLAGKWIKKIDLREYGSGTVSASMVWEHVAKWALFPVGIFDILKGAIPTWICMDLNMGLPAIALICLSAVIGHNWPIFLQFHGGRGLSPFLGILFAGFPYGFLIMIVALGLGVVLDISAPLTLILLLLFPSIVGLLDGPAFVSTIAVGMTIITLIKRIEANGRPLPQGGKERWVVIARRLFLDRDMRDHQSWLQRTPSQDDSGEKHD